MEDNKLTTKAPPPAPARATLLSLPDELLLQIFHHCIPAELKFEQVVPGRSQRQIYHRFLLQAVVNRRYHSVAMTSFFDTYVHDVEATYATWQDSVYYYRSIPLRHDRIKKLKFSIEAYSLDTLRKAAADIEGYLETFPKLRGLKIHVRTSTHHDITPWLQRPKLSVWFIVRSWAQRNCGAVVYKYSVNPGFLQTKTCVSTMVGRGCDE
ncbi:hypothetical protein LTR97_006357 [Elasticomyces elasticus]|uniref:F-box domain-containing protein n=1 Tax=Elasticomyces elasticus TaxID=574655 RepID=A0AAN7ZN64_9PEZI|nr:hypothetical protein LTR97_006357 [Elasticomyces elasticus]